VSGTATYTGAPTATNSVGRYTITYSSGLSLGGGNASAYTLAAGPGVSWSVAARPINVTAPTGLTKVYGSANPTFTSALEAAGSSRGLVNNDTFSGGLTSAATSTSGVGSNGVTQSRLDNTNYIINYTSANLSVTAKPLTMSGLSVPASKVYDGNLVAVVSGTPALAAA
jgi:hypothetical protein